MNQAKKTAKTTRKSTSVKKTTTGSRKGAVSPEERRHMIAEDAYYRAERRNFQSGSPEQDWLEAEAEIDNSSAM